MTHLLPFEPAHRPAVAALWRALHSEFDWLDDPEKAEKAMTMEPPNHIGYVALRDDAVIGSALGSCASDPSVSRNRHLMIEAQPENLTADWIVPALAAFADADRDHPDTWHVVTLLAPSMARLRPIVGPILESAGFAVRETILALDWEGEHIDVVDPGAAVFERYTGGDPAVDAELVDLHARAYRPRRLVPPTSLEYLWYEMPGLTHHEFVLAREAGKLVGYAEFMVTNGKPYINSMVAARSHWGKSIGAAVGTKAMEILLGMGHRTLHATVSTTNAAARALHHKHGWRDLDEHLCTYVREIAAP